MRDGIFQLTEDLFGVEIEPWDTPTWHEDVETYEILENGELLGRFYMDNIHDPSSTSTGSLDFKNWHQRQTDPDVGLAQNFPKV